jgi:serine/threonine protein kinase/tetratricopeptide (TPR) repeat protein
MKCPKCRFENAESARFCAECGTRIRGHVAVSSEPGACPQDSNGIRRQATKTLLTPSLAIALGGVFAARYEIIEEMGRGGMGIVYKARDSNLDRKVALKFLPPEWTCEPGANERFIREARAAAALDHPHICAVYEFGEAEGRTFISMAYVEGETLQRKIERTVLKPGDAVDIGIQVASGLSEAHRKGIVHRDIKSSNIMVSGQGQAKILDFGLAKIRGGIMVTKEGATMGTVAYMSPEQARGEKVDHRTDIWSLGVVLYQALTGQMPFPGEQDQAVLHSILHRKPKPLRTLDARVPAALERIVGRALKKKPDERYENADEMLTDLRSVKKELESGSLEEGLSWPAILVKRRVPQILGLYLLASLGVLQLVKWLVNRFVLSPHLPDFSLAASLSMVPAVLLLAFFHGRPGRQNWAKAVKIGIPVNVMASAALLVFLFSGKSLGAATTTITLTNEEGRTVERVVPKGEFRQSLVLFFFDNETNDSSLGWLQYGIPRLLQLDLVQDLFVTTSLAYDFIDEIRAAGFQDGLGLPLTLMDKIALERHAKAFVSGSISKDGDAFVLRAALYESRRAAVITESEFRGQDFFELTDRMSLKIRRDLQIPEHHLGETKDLPVSELGTASSRAFESYVRGVNAMVFERDWDTAGQNLERSVREDPAFVFPYFEIQFLAAVTNQREKREQAFQAIMKNLYRLPDRQQYIIKSAYYAFKEDRKKQIAVLKMMVETSPEDIAGRGELANLYSAASQWDDALAELLSIVELDPGQKDVLLGISSLYQRKGEFSKALEFATKYAAQFPEDVKPFVLIGGLYRAMGDFERAKSSLAKALLIEPENISALLVLADVEAARGDFGASEGTCREVLKIAKTPQDRVRALESLSKVFETQARCRESLETILLLFREMRTSRPPFLALVSQIAYLDKFVKAGRTDEAFKVIEDIRSEAAPPFDQLVALTELSVYAALEDSGKAAAALKTVDSVPLSPEFENNRMAIVYYRGRVHEMKGEFGQAIDAYGEFLEARPAETVVGLARSYRKLKEFKKAEAYLQKCLKVNPSDPELHYELALVHIDRKETKQALEHLKIALDVWKNADPGIPMVEDARKRLAGLM